MTDAIADLLAVMARLRDPEHGCPWDREQSHASLAPYTLEEAYEVADAVERGALDELCGELGDLLFQVVFYARIAEEEGRFDFERVAAGLAEKLRRRHPHVFGGAPIASAAAQMQAWEEHKARERRAGSGGRSAAGTFDGIALALPALVRAVKLQRRAARTGFDWPDLRAVLAKVEEELEELRAEIDGGGDRAHIDHELGDLLLAASNLARFLDIDPEAALRRANRRFEWRFGRMETLASEQGGALEALTLEQMEQLWRQAKAEERAGSGPPLQKDSEDDSRS